MNKPLIKRRWLKGFTIIELMISISVLLIIMALVTHMIVTTNRTQNRVRMENHLRSGIQTALFRISAQLNQTRMIMGSDTLGYAYLNRLSFAGAPPIAGSSPSATLSVTHSTTSRHLLPTIMPTGSLSPEKTCNSFPNNFFRANSVGNMLLFSQYIGKFNRINIADVALRRSLDLYEFKLYYITDDNNAPVRNFLDYWSSTPNKRALRLIEWTSRPYVDYTQLQNYITDSTVANRAIIRSSLTGAGLQRAWNRSATAINNAFYDIAGVGATLASNAGHVVERARINDILKFGSDAYSIAYNTNMSTGATYFPIRDRVPFFYNHEPPDCNGASPAPNTTPNTNLGQFPYGFEVIITGPPSGRNVLTRISSAARSYNGLISHADMLTTFARDL